MTSELHAEVGEETVDQLRTRFNTGLLGLGLGREVTRGTDNSSAVMGTLGLLRLLLVLGWYDSYAWTYERTWAEPPFRRDASACAWELLEVLGCRLG